MKKILTIILAMMTVGLMVPSCTGDPWASYTKTSDSGDVDDDDDDDDTTQDIDPYDSASDYSSFSADYTVTVTYSSSGATVSGDTDNVTVTTSGSQVVATCTASKSVNFILTGSSSSGLFNATTVGDVCVTMKGLTLTNSTGAPVAIKTTEGTGFVYVSGTNTLSDGASYTDGGTNDKKGALWCKGGLIFAGDGSLTITAKGAAGVWSTNYIKFDETSSCTVKVTASASHGMRAKNAVIVLGSPTIDISSSAAMKKGILSKGYYQQDGGSINIKVSGSAAYDSDDGDVSGTHCVKSGGNFVFNGGSLTAVNSGNGGKAIKASGIGYLCGGYIYAQATGSNYTYGNTSTSAKGAKFDGNVVISGGEYEFYSSSHEGIETKGTFTMTDGSVYAYAADDAINSAGDMKISGGYVYGHGTSNDGIDSNGAIYISGDNTVVIGEGAGAPEVGIDALEGKYVYLQGGYVISYGGGYGPTIASPGAFVTTTQSYSTGTKVGLFDSSGNALVGYVIPSMGSSTRATSSGTLVIYTSSMSSGSSYTLKSGVTFTPTVFENAAISGISGGSSSVSLTALSSGGQEGGGGTPGGDNPGGGTGGGQPGGGSQGGGGGRGGGR